MFLLLLTFLVKDSRQPLVAVVRHLLVADSRILMRGKPKRLQDSVDIMAKQMPAWCHYWALKGYHRNKATQVCFSLNVRYSVSSIVHLGLLHLSFDVELGLELYMYPLSYIFSCCWLKGFQGFLFSFDFVIQW